MFSNLNKKQVAVGVVSLAATFLLGYKLYQKNYSNTKSPERTLLENYYHEQHYLFKLPTPALTQLLWLQNNSTVTPEANARVGAPSTPAVNIEIKRAFSRWNCFNLLIQGDETAYQQFVVSQPVTDRLDYKTFVVLSGLLQQLSATNKEAVGISSFLSMSDKAKDLAKEKSATVSIDPEKFMTDTLLQCPEIYPVWQSASHGAQQLLPEVFLSDSHGRHMLYTEGGQNMFTVLRTRIRAGSLSKAQYEAWFARWLVNIAGFRGHLQAQGSVYLTQKTANAVLALKGELDNLWENPDYDVLTNYLKIRARWLGVDSLLLAHFGSMMRLYIAKEGAELQQWFQSLSHAQRQTYELGFEQLCKNTQVTPTYEPAVLDTLLGLKCSIAEAMSIHAMITSKAGEAYFKGIASNRINNKTPLCYREIARKENLQLFIDAYRQQAPLSEEEITVDDQGFVVSLSMLKQAAKLKALRT